jgi:hypothetical protein
MAMLRRAINQAALAKSTGNSGNSCNIRANLLFQVTLETKKLKTTAGLNPNHRFPVGPGSNGFLRSVL